MEAANFAGEFILIKVAEAGYRAAGAESNFRSRDLEPFQAGKTGEYWMRRISTFLLGMATGAMLLHGATMYHVVRASDGLHFIPKQPPRLAETYTDIRRFTMEDWAGHAQLATAMVQAGQQQLLGEAATGSIRDTLNSALPARLKQ